MADIIVRPPELWGQPLKLIDNGDGTYSIATWDMWRNNLEGVLLANAARTAMTVSPQQINYNGKGVTLYLYVTAKAGATTLKMHIQFIEPTNNATLSLADTGFLAAEVGGWYSFQI